MRKATITCLIFLLGFTSMLFAADYSGGSGTEAEPWQIATKADLKTLSETSADWASHFIQTADIEFTSADFQSGGDFYNDGKGFSPIGFYVGYQDLENSPFTGSFDGQQYTIENLFIDDSDENTGDCSALFGYILNSQLTNIGLINVDIVGNDYTGCLVGLSQGTSTVSNCFATGTIEGDFYIGGLVGTLSSGTISNCYSLVNISGNQSVGGFIGEIVGSSVSYSFCSGSISGNGDIGGFIGKNWSYSPSTLLASFWNTDNYSTSNGGTGKTTAQMKNLSTFTDAGWDFVGETTNGSNDYWDMNSSDNDGYPFLNWQEFESQDPAIYYVDSTKTDDSGAGTSWETAKTTLHAALELAVSGDQIWVKAGTYFPTSAYDLTNTSRYYHFRMKNGVAIYGGFAGTESAVSERANYGMGEANETILSGDLNQDDVVTGSGQTLSFSNNSENCFHVFYHPSGLGLDTTAVLDGFTVRGGNASDPGYSHIIGAGMYNDSNSPTLNSVNMIYNSALYSAAGMYNNTSSPVIINSSISWNKSGDQAGGMYNLSGNPSLTNTMVLNNYANSFGGGMINQNNAAPVFTNVLIAGNYSGSGGGGIYNHTGVTPTLTNVTITNNAANGGGGGVRNWYGSSGTYNNCIVFGNTGTEGNEFYLGNGMASPAGTVTLNYSCYGNASGDVYNSGTTFTTTNNNITSNPQIVDAAGSDYRIYNTSPCADVGNDAYNSETTDIRGTGFGRKLDKTTGNAGTIDMGAYEYKYGTDPVNELNIVTFEPTENAVGVDLDTELSVTFDRAAQQSSVDATSFVAWGSQSGLLSGSISFSNEDTEATFTLSSDLFAGEIVRTVLTDEIGNTTGGYLNPMQWQVTAGPSIWHKSGNFTELTKNFVGISGNASWGDYDQDGHLDFIESGLSDESSTMVEKSVIYHNNGDGTLGDYDQDGHLDFVESGLSDESSTMVEKSVIYHNNGDGTFTDIDAGIQSFQLCDIAWGDYDNDHDLDLLIAGYRNQPTTSTYTILYRNDGNGTFTDINAGFPGCMNCAVAWGDYDNDGYLDFILIGRTWPSGFIIKLYHNDGDGTFTENTTSGLPADYFVMANKIAWGDYDNDGYVDVVVMGAKMVGYSQKPVLELYHNNQDGTFTANSSAGFLDVNSGSLAWGDYNRDGYLDLAVCGTDTVQTRHTSIYENNRDGTFTDINPGMTGITGSINWGDYDNDGYLDIALAGRNTSTSRVTEVYHNTSGTGFTQLSAELTESSDGSVVWGDFDNDNDLDLLRTGRTNGDPYSRLTILYRNDPIPPAQAENVQFADVYNNQTKISWTRGDGDSCAVFLKQASSGTASPVESAYYSADSVFASGDQIGTSGWYAVYRGTDTTVTVTGLSDNTTYRAHVCEFNTESTLYNSDSTTGNPANQTTVLAVPEIDIRGNYVSIADGDTIPSLTDHTNFDSVSVASDSLLRTFTIHNTGSATLYIGVGQENSKANFNDEKPVRITIENPVVISGTHSLDFSVTQEPASSVAAGDSTTFTLKFDPSATGVRSATVTVYNNDSDEGTYSFAIQGLGTDPEIDVRGNYLSIADGDTTPSVVDSTSFGSAAVDDGTINRTFKIFNTGNESLYIGLAKSAAEMNAIRLNNSGPTEIVFINGTHADDFSVTEQPDSHSIQPGDSVSFTVQFDPAAGGTRTANVYFFNSDSDEENYNFYISGVGITPPTVTTATFDSITVISAVGGGNVTDNGGASVTAKGVCWGLAENPTVDSSHTSNGTGSDEFTSSLTGLAHGTTYHVRAYATNSAGTGYGADSTFTTEQIIVSISPADTLLKGGQEVTYTVSIANVLPAMRGYTLHVGYNGEHFSDATITQGNYLSSVGTTQWDASGSNGSYDIDCAILGTTDGKTGDGTLFTVQLTTASSVTDSLVNPEFANLTVSSITLRDVINDPIVCDESNGATIIIDTAPPTMEAITEADSVWYRSGPTLSNFGFDDNYALECVGYKVNAGEWDVISDDITGTEYNNDGISLPTYSSLAERTGVHTIYFYAVDDAGNLSGYADSNLHFSFYKDETAPDGELAITFTEVGVRSMNVVSAAFEDATQGEVYYQFDCTSQDYYDRARTLADSVHECYEMNANTEYKFKYQVSDGVADPNETPAYNATAWSTEYSKYTLSVAPTTSTVTCDKSGTISTTTLTFTAVGGFGAGKVEYYRYVLDDSTTHTWTGSETQWSSGNLQMGIPTANTNYYLHVKGFNAEDVANGTLALGPYQWDGTPISPVTELSFEATGEDNNSADMSWTNPEHDAHYIEVWVKGFGGYPQYTGSKPEFPTTPTEASQGGWTQLMDSLATAYTYTPSNRDYYYCAVFVEDLAEHYSAAAIDSSLSYWLGDVNATPDGLVNSADIAILASAYRTESGDNDYNAVCDVGPTTNYGRTSRPVPDQSISFEDLMIFAMNYENTGSHKLKKTAGSEEVNPIALKMNIQKVGTQFVAQIQLENNDAFVKGLEIPIVFGADLAISSVRKGGLVTSSDFFDSSQHGQTVYISVASLGNNGVFDCDGVVAEIVFKVSGANTAIQFADASARSKSNGTIEVSYDYTDVALLSEGLIPTEYKLHQNYPNPFNPSTTIMYDLKESGRVKITLFNINGQRIATVLDQVKDAGYHSYIFEAGNLPSGVYIYRIEVNDFSDVRKLVLMK